MAISPIGGVVYANQNMQVPATQQAEFQQRIDAQATAAMAASNEEKKEIEEIRPTEETLELDPEKDHEKSKQDQQKEDEKSGGEIALEEELSDTSVPQQDEDHLLDITI